MSIKLSIRKIKPTDAALMHAYYSKNFERLRASIPSKQDTPDDLQFWEKLMPQIMNQEKYQVSARFIMLSDDRVVGVCSLLNILFEPYYSAIIGFSIDEEFEGQGLMKKAVEHTLIYAFDELKLHRITAHHAVTNERSKNLLERVGFKLEGTAERLMFINNQWLDHYVSTYINYGFELPE